MVGRAAGPHLLAWGGGVFTGFHGGVPGPGWSRSVLLHRLLRFLAGKAGVWSLGEAEPVQWLMWPHCAPCWLHGPLHPLAMASLLPWLRLATCAGGSPNIYQPARQEYQPVRTGATLCC